MSPAETDRVRAAARGRAGLELWLIPTGTLLALLLVFWLLKPAVVALLASETVVNCDTVVLAWFRSFATPPLDRLFQVITLFGSPFAMTVYAFLGLSMLVNRRQWLLLFSWDILFLGLWAMTQSIKPLFQRARPAGAEQFLMSSSYSFPSTHALCGVAGVGMIAFVLAETVEMEREPRLVLWLVTTTLAIAIGTSRLYLGVHYLSDVLAGALLGALWLAVCLYAYRRARVQLQQLAPAQVRSR